MQMEDEEGFSEDDQGAEQQGAGAFGAAKVLHRLSETLEDVLPMWIRRTVMSTFGCIARSALKQFTGGDDRDIGYYLPKRQEGGRPSIVLFDKLTIRQRVLQDWSLVPAHPTSFGKRRMMTIDSTASAC